LSNFSLQSVATDQFLINLVAIRKLLSRMEKQLSLEQYEIWRLGNVTELKVLDYSTQLKRIHTSRHFSANGTTGPTGTGPPNYRGFAITLSYTHHTRKDSSGRVITPKQRHLPENAQHSNETDTNAPGGIGTSNSSKRAAANPCLGRCGHWDRPFVSHRQIKSGTPR
jgi:hypothetical protein